MPSNELGSNPREVLKQRLIELLREPLLVAIEHEWSDLLRRETIVLSRGEYKDLKWEVVRAIVGNGE